MNESTTMNCHLTTEFRSDLRFFAFFVANGSLFADSFWNRYGFEYITFLIENKSILGQLFSIFVNVWQPRCIAERAKLDFRNDPQFRAEQYLMNQIDSGYEVTPQFEPWELVVSGSEISWKECVNEFSMSLAVGRLEPSVLGGSDYVSGLFNCGSTLEAIFAVFSNVLLIDEHGNPTNKERAYFRAAQCTKQWCVPGYEVEPQFEGWETELH